MILEPHREVLFPDLNRTEYLVTSDETPAYNCLAWAAGDSTRWWSPRPGNYWPEAARREETLDSFRVVFEDLGYQRCETDELEPGSEKVAIFVDNEGLPTHAARQLTDGSWTSKLGSWQDIEHQHLRDLSGTASIYGVVALIMRRPDSRTPG